MRPNHQVWISRQARDRMEAELVELLAVAEDDSTDWDQRIRLVKRGSGRSRIC